MVRRSVRHGRAFGATMLHGPAIYTDPNTERVLKHLALPCMPARVLWTNQGGDVSPRLT